MKTIFLITLCILIFNNSLKIQNKISLSQQNSIPEINNLSELKDKSVFLYVYNSSILTFFHKDLFYSQDEMEKYLFSMQDYIGNKVLFAKINDTKTQDLSIKNTPTILFYAKNQIISNIESSDKEIGIWILENSKTVEEIQELDYQYETIVDISKEKVDEYKKKYKQLVLIKYKELVYSSKLLDDSIKTNYLSKFPKIKFVKVIGNFKNVVDRISNNHFSVLYLNGELYKEQIGFNESVWDNLLNEFYAK